MFCNCLTWHKQFNEISVINLLAWQQQTEKMKIIKKTIIESPVFHEEFIFVCIHRVLRPPGGGSSNIFGAEPVQRGSGSRPKSNDIFGTGPVEPTDDHRGKRRGGPSDNSRDNVFGGSTVNDSGSNTRAENKRRGQGNKYVSL